MEGEAQNRQEHRPPQTVRFMDTCTIHILNKVNLLEEEQLGADDDEYELPRTYSPVSETQAPPRVSPRKAHSVTSHCNSSPQRATPAGEQEVRRFLDSIIPSMAWLLEDLLAFGFTDGSYLFGAAQQSSDCLQRTIQHLQVSIASRKRRQMTPLQEDLLRSAIEGYNWTSDPAVYAYSNS